MGAMRICQYVVHSSSKRYKNLAGHQSRVKLPFAVEVVKPHFGELFRVGPAFFGIQGLQLVGQAYNDVAHRNGIVSRTRSRNGTSAMRVMMNSNRP